MPLVPSFSVAQSALNPSAVIFVDTSTGSDGAISERRITIQNALGEYVVPSGTVTTYIVWPLADTTYTVDGLLTEDTAANVTVLWVNVAGTTLYSASNTFCFAEYNKQGFYGVVANQAANPGVYQDTSYSGNLATWWTNIKGAEVSVEEGGDISSSQNCLNRATNFLNNENFYF